MKFLLIVFILASFLLMSPVFAYDYTQMCQSAGSCSCKSEGTVCSSNDQCYLGTCSYSCPSPKSNSVLTGNTCNSLHTICECSEVICQGGTCLCSVTGTCEYTCENDYEWDGNNCVATATTSTTSSTTSSSTTSSSTTSTTLPVSEYDFEPDAESIGLFTIGKPDPVLIYVKNTGKNIDSYIISYTKEARNQRLESVPHLIDVSFESNRIAFVASADVKTTQAVVTLLGPIKEGKITFYITSNATEESKQTSIDLSAGFPSTLPEFNFLGMLLIISLSVLIIFYSLHVDKRFFNCF